MCIMTKDEARTAGRAAAEAGKVRLFDVTGHMAHIGLAPDLRSSYLLGIEDHLQRTAKAMPERAITG